MTIETTYTNAREHLADLLDEVEENQEVVFITRRGHENVALVAASELAALIETAHLLRSPRNAQRLLAALSRVEKRRGKKTTLSQLRESLGLSDS